MKKTVYIINAILFMGCCLLVSTTVPNIKSIDIDNNITYVNSNEIKKEDVIEVASVENISEVNEEPVVVEKVQEKIVDEKPKEDITVKDEIIEDNNTVNNEKENITSIAVGSIFSGTMSGYGSDIWNFTASGHYIGDSIYYSDFTYGNVRILSGDDVIPFGTIIRVTNSKIGNFIGIVIDTGNKVGFDKVHDFDLLFKTSKEALDFGVSINTTFEVLRVGY